MSVFGFYCIVTLCTVVSDSIVCVYISAFSLARLSHGDDAGRTFDVVLPELRYRTVVRGIDAGVSLPGV